MGADRWSRCPRCWRRANQDLVNRQVGLNASYGKVSLQEWVKESESLARETDLLDEMNETFRQSWDFSGLTDGVVHVEYSGSCTVCKLVLEFEEDHVIPGVDS